MVWRSRKHPLEPVQSMLEPIATRGETLPSGQWQPLRQHGGRRQEARSYPVATRQRPWSLPSTCLWLAPGRPRICLQPPKLQHNRQCGDLSGVSTWEWPRVSVCLLRPLWLSLASWSAGAEGRQPDRFQQELWRGLIFLQIGRGSLQMVEQPNIQRIWRQELFQEPWFFHLLQCT